MSCTVSCASPWLCSSASVSLAKWICQVIAEEEGGEHLHAGPVMDVCPVMCRSGGGRNTILRGREYAALQQFM